MLVFPLRSQPQCPCRRYALLILYDAHHHRVWELLVQVLRSSVFACFMIHKDFPYIRAGAYVGMTRPSLLCSDSFKHVHARVTRGPSCLQLLLPNIMICPWLLAGEMSFCRGRFHSADPKSTSRNKAQWRVWDCRGE
jgi:hypothetical protein